MNIFRTILIVLGTAGSLTTIKAADMQNPFTAIPGGDTSIEPFLDTTGEFFDTGTRFVNADRLWGPEEIPLIIRTAVPFQFIPREWGAHSQDTPLPLGDKLRANHERRTLLPEEGNWDYVLPDTIEPPKNRTVPGVKSRDQKWTYLDTPHFRIAYDTATITDTRAITLVFRDMETAYILGKIYPLHFSGAQTHLVPEKYTFYIYGKKEEFKEKTGTDAPGVHINGICYINGELFNLATKSPPKDSSVAQKSLYEVCVHEWIHTVEPAQMLAGTPFTEGFAMYIDKIGIQDSGSIQMVGLTDRMLKKIADQVGLPHDNQSSLELPYRFPEGFGKIMTAPEIIYNPEEEDKCICLNRTRALLITAYFMHMDRNGDGKNLKDFLRMMQQGFPRETCIERLKDGRSWDQLFSEFKTAWQKYGANVTTL